MVYDIVQQPRFNFIGEFRSRDTESQYRDNYSEHNKRRLSFICFFSSIAYFLGIIPNIYALRGSNEFNIMLMIRFGCLFLGFAAAFAAWGKKSKSAPYLSIIVIAYMLVVGVSESVEAAFFFDTYQGVILPTTPIIVLMYYLFVPMEFSISFVASLFMSVLYVITLFFFTESPLPHSITMILFFSLANLYGCYHVINFNRMRRKEFFAVIQQKRLNAALVKEINTRQEVEKRLIRLTTIDDLTGIYNRRYFLEFFERERETSLRYKRPLSLMMIDVDHFKKINDTYGHDAGDLVLKAMTRYILRAIRAVDIFARFGGEEFVVLLPAAGLEEAAVAAERILGIVAKSPVPIAEECHRITVSIGVSTMTASCNSMDEIIKAADVALYRAKEAGRNRVYSIDSDAYSI